jgi:hypothetical protein
MYSKKPIKSDNSSRAYDKSKFVKAKSSTENLGFKKNNINSSEKRTEKTSLTYNRAPRRDSDFGGFSDGGRSGFGSSSRRTGAECAEALSSRYEEVLALASVRLEEEPKPDLPASEKPPKPLSRLGALL